jgi:peptidase M64-like protein
MRGVYNRVLMRFRVILATLLLASSAHAARFDDFFTGKTMRVDYFHTGNKGEEIFALDRVVPTVRGRAAAPTSSTPRTSATTSSR